jgi:hypothetical protein
MNHCIPELHERFETVASFVEKTSFKERIFNQLQMLWKEKKTGRNSNNKLTVPTRGNVKKKESNFQRNRLKQKNRMHERDNKKIENRSNNSLQNLRQV